METKTVIYLQLSHENYKGIEKQMMEFKETVHKTATGFYHKSIRIRVDENTVMEYHGPIVRAAEEQQEDGNS